MNEPGLPKLSQGSYLTGVVWTIGAIVGLEIVTFLLASAVTKSSDGGDALVIAAFQPGFLQILTTPALAYRFWTQHETKSLQATLIVGGVLLLINGLCAGFLLTIQH